MPFDGAAPREEQRYIVTPASPLRYRPGESLSIAGDPISATQYAIKIAKDELKRFEVWTAGPADVPRSLLALVHPSGRVDVSRYGCELIPAGMTLADEMQPEPVAIAEPVLRQVKTASRFFGVAGLAVVVWTIVIAVAVVLIRVVEAGVQ